MKASGWHTCNVADGRGTTGGKLWQFTNGASIKAPVLEVEIGAEESFPRKQVSKDWQQLWRRKLNVAWLPPDHLYLRVLHMPGSSPEELHSMVELQLEKISPLPLSQIVWSMEMVGETMDNLQTIIVLIAERRAVEAFLEGLEERGYSTNCLELPFVRQLLAQHPETDGAWIYPEVDPMTGLCLVAWWFGGRLRNLSLVHLPRDRDPLPVLQEHLNQNVWAGEMEGWLTETPRWYLVAGPEQAAAFETLLREWTDRPVDVVDPLPEKELARLSAAGAGRKDSDQELVPEEYHTRYRQRFVDRLWMRGLGAVMVLYIVGVLIYFAGLQVVKFQYTTLSKEIAARDKEYKDAIELKERVAIVAAQVQLRFAALDCWDIVSRLLPDGLTLNSLNFQRGKELRLRGLATEDRDQAISEFNADMRAVERNGKRFFSQVDPETTKQGKDRSGNTTTWWFNCQLNLDNE